MKKIWSAAVVFAALALLVLGAYADPDEAYTAVIENEPVLSRNEAHAAVIENELVLDQNEAYIAISKNDIDGYNRWLPFYFTLSTIEDMDAESAEKMLESEIDQAVLYTEDGEFYHTGQMVWSTVKQGKGKYNLTLVLIPERDSLPLDGAANVTNITLVSGTEKYSYDLPAYFVEERTTIPENDLYVSLSSFESEISGDSTAYSNYGIMKNGNDIQEFSLDFSQKYKPVIGCSIVNEDQTEGKAAEAKYSAMIRLAENSEKAVFRPFIKVVYGDQKSGFLIPSLPVYFKAPEAG